MVGGGDDGGEALDRECRRLALRGSVLPGEATHGRAHQLAAAWIRHAGGAVQGADRCPRCAHGTDDGAGLSACGQIPSHCYGRRRQRRQAVLSAPGGKDSGLAVIQPPGVGAGGGGECRAQCRIEGGAWGGQLLVCLDGAFHSAVSGS